MILTGAFCKANDHRNVYTSEFVRMFIIILCCLLDQWSMHKTDDGQWIFSASNCVGVFRSPYKNMCRHFSEQIQPKLMSDFANQNGRQNHTQFTRPKIVQKPFVQTIETILGLVEPTKKDCQSFWTLWHLQIPYVFICTVSLRQEINLELCCKMYSPRFSSLQLIKFLKHEGQCKNVVLRCTIAYVSMCECVFVCNKWLLTKKFLVRNSHEKRSFQKNVCFHFCLTKKFLIKLLSSLVRASHTNPLSFFPHPQQSTCPFAEVQQNDDTRFSFCLLNSMAKEFSSINSYAVRICFVTDTRVFRCSSSFFLYTEESRVRTFYHTKHLVVIIEAAIKTKFDLPFHLEPAKDNQIIQVKVKQRQLSN